MAHMHNHGILVALVCLVAGCNSSLQEYICSADKECQDSDPTGRCEASNHCSFIDRSCENNRRYGTDSGSNSYDCLSESICHPANDVVAAGAINADCSPGKGCYLDDNGSAECFRVPNLAVDLSQNQNCYAASVAADCLRSSCASGFGAILYGSADALTSTVCARHCTPVNTHAGLQARTTGANAKCSAASLEPLGGTNGVTSQHQCRFLNSFYTDTAQWPDRIGMCVPVLSPGGGTWADCKLLDWEGIKNAVDGSENTTASFTQFCRNDDGELKPQCAGLYRGCLSDTELKAGLPELFSDN